MNNYWVCITAKNEARTISEIVKYLTTRNIPVIVVDDGSSDGTGDLAGKAGAQVIWHKSSKGIAPSLMEAWKMALSSGAEYIAQLDAGGSHDPGYLERLNGRFSCSEADIVIGSRFVRGGKYQGRIWRMIASRLVSLLLNYSQRGPKIKDWTSGYRLFTRRAIIQLLNYKYVAKMHAWQAETLGRARMEGLAIKEAAITYKAGKSSLGWTVISELIMVWLVILHEMQVHE